MEIPSPPLANDMEILTFVDETFPQTDLSDCEYTRVMYGISTQIIL